VTNPLIFAQRGGEIIKNANTTTKRLPFQKQKTSSISPKGFLNTKYPNKNSKARVRKNHENPTRQYLLILCFPIKGTSKRVVKKTRMEKARPLAERANRCPTVGTRSFSRTIPLRTAMPTSATHIVNPLIRTLFIKIGSPDETPRTLVLTKLWDVSGHKSIP